LVSIAAPSYSSLNDKKYHPVNVGRLSVDELNQMKKQYKSFGFNIDHVQYQSCLGVIGAVKPAALKYSRMNTPLKLTELHEYEADSLVFLAYFNGELSMSNVSQIISSRCKVTLNEARTVIEQLIDKGFLIEGDNDTLQWPCDDVKADLLKTLNSTGLDEEEILAFSNPAGCAGVVIERVIMKCCVIRNWQPNCSYSLDELVLDAPITEPILNTYFKLSPDKGIDLMLVTSKSAGLLDFKFIQVKFSKNQSSAVSLSEDEVDAIATNNNRSIQNIVNKMHTEGKLWSDTVSEKLHCKPNIIEYYFMTTCTCSTSALEYAKRHNVQVMDKNELIEKVWTEFVLAVGKLVQAKALLPS